ncbi:hypothetical protein O181_024997 [Austropuccinia psidii MF-1]|uniref:Uncharacterized protein n=1 Tax=Austropuccinia psidii MF-1 TaxID=1389203 RepID=A0A9Q3CMM0_9BASI|nr:hypothetical protein [Austropuccinia psidii MF-1]
MPWSTRRGQIGHKEMVWPIGPNLVPGWNCHNTNGGGSFFVVVTVECLLNMPPMLLTILTLVECPPDIPPMLVECLPNMPPRPLTILILAVPSRHVSNAPYYPYACGVPCQHASNAAYHPYACSALPTCLQRCLPSLLMQCPPEMPPKLLICVCGNRQVLCNFYQLLDC